MSTSRDSCCLPSVKKQKHDYGTPELSYDTFFLLYWVVMSLYMVVMLLYSVSFFTVFSRVFIGLAIMIYEPLYHDLQKWRAHA